MELGLMQAGINVIQSLDLDVEATDCMSINRHYFSHTVLTVDIKDKTVLEQPSSDIIVGTYPCTKYSAIADIHGTRTGDDLFLHFFRHIAIEQPEMYIVENVPGMKKFKVVMEAMTKLPNYYVTVFLSHRCRHLVTAKKTTINSIWRQATLYYHCANGNKEKAGTKGCFGEKS